MRSERPVRSVGAARAARRTRRRGPPAVDVRATAGPAGGRSIDPNTSVWSPTEEASPCGSVTSNGPGSSSPLTGRSLSSSSPARSRSSAAAAPCSRSSTPTIAATAIVAALDKRSGGVLNIVDDDPTAPAINCDWRPDYPSWRWVRGAWRSDDPTQNRSPVILAFAREHV